MKNFFENFTDKMIVGTLTFFLLAVVCGFMYMVYIAFGLYSLLIPPGLLIFYTIGHFLVELID